MGSLDFVSSGKIGFTAQKPQLAPLAQLDADSVDLVAIRGTFGAWALLSFPRQWSFLVSGFRAFAGLRNVPGGVSLLR
jgi:hypothetical protein